MLQTPHACLPQKPQGAVSLHGEEDQEQEGRSGTGW